MLDLVGGVVPREVQVTKLAGDVTAGPLKRCSLTVEGIAAGDEPRKVAEDLRTAIAEKFTAAGPYRNVASSFKSLEDGKDAAKLDGRQLPTATFAIAVQMETGEAPPPPPPPRKPRERKTAEL